MGQEISLLMEERLPAPAGAAGAAVAAVATTARNVWLSPCGALSGEWRRWTASSATLTKKSPRWN